MARRRRRPKSELGLWIVLAAGVAGAVVVLTLLG
jgi:type VI protein secretion system component VasF